MWQAPWWVLLGFVAGLVASSFMVLYWLYSLRVTIARKGWRHTSRFLVLPWTAIFLVSISGFLRTLGIIELGGTIDTALTYTTTMLIYATLLTLVASLLLDIRVRNRQLDYKATRVD